MEQGAGFTREERAVFGLEGFLPYDTHSLEKQCHRAWNQLLKVRSIPLQLRSTRAAELMIATVGDPKTRFPRLSPRSKSSSVLSINAGSSERASGDSLHSWSRRGRCELLFFIPETGTSLLLFLRILRASFERGATLMVQIGCFIVRELPGNGRGADDSLSQTKTPCGPSSSRT